MKPEAFNAVVMAANAITPLRGVTRRGVGGTEHHWAVTAERAQGELQWRVRVGPGTVNDRMTAIGYLRKGDPRGWVLPEDHPSIPLMRQIYGENFQFVDRDLTETIDPPYLLITAPGLVSSQRSDFRRVADDRRLGVPQVFRTAEMWERELYTASVFVTATPKFFTRAEDAFGFPVPTRVSRFRIGVAPELPAASVGTGTGAAHELARLFLTRVPGSPRRDQLHVEQRCFWSLWTATYSPSFFGSLDPSAILTGNLLIDVSLETVIRAVSSLFEASGSTQFWSAA